MMIEKAGVDMTANCILWVKARPDYEALFYFLEGLHSDAERRYWLEPVETVGNITGISDIGEEIRQIRTEVKS